MAWDWPQWTMAILLGLTLFIHAVNDGKAQNRKYSAGVKLVDTIVGVVILYFGGFWTP